MSALRPKHKICRRLGVRICGSQNCPLLKKPYPPGVHGPRQRRKSMSEFGRKLLTKQILRYWYNLKERQFKRYVKEALASSRKEDAQTALVRRLEKRLDNVVYRAGFAVSRYQARQLISHRHIMLNGRRVNIPSIQVRVGDTVSIHKDSLKKGVFLDLPLRLKNYTPPSWLELDKERFEVKITREPELEDAQPPVELSTIFEFYSR